MTWHLRPLKDHYIEIEEEEEKRTTIAMSDFKTINFNIHIEIK